MTQYEAIPEAIHVTFRLGVCIAPYIAPYILLCLDSSGVSVNVQDLAPSCAGALFGMIHQ